MNKRVVFCRGAGVALRILITGQLLFLALTAVYAVQTGASVFRYAQF